MAIDSIRLLRDSATQVWQRLASYGEMDTLASCECFECWATFPQGQPAENELPFIRRDFRRFREIFTELETLMRSRQQALDLLRAPTDELPARPQTLPAELVAAEPIATPAE